MCCYQCNDLMNATTFYTIAKALTLHVAEARRKQWCLPARLPPAHSGARLEITGMVPYWMDPSQPASKVVRNDISIQEMVVLTGPNTAGKSTIMRSVCAVSLLGNCGLLVPAAAAIVPFQDSYFLRAGVCFVCLMCC